MRIHRTHQLLAPWSTGRPVLDPARLAVMRVEPALRQRRPAFVVDLYLADDAGATVVPNVFVDPAVVVEGDRDPLIFPQGTPFDDAVANELASRVLPHLQSLVLGEAPVVEHVVSFAPAPRFDAARAAGCFGAAPLRDALVRLAPYSYARRFARSRSVLIDAPSAVGGWVLLRGVANAGIADRRREAAEIDWYGDAARAPEAPEVAIVAADADAAGARCVIRLDVESPDAIAVVDPLPLDVGVSFDPAEGPSRRFFAVERAVEPAPRALPELAYAPAGGSEGRIAVMLGRGDALLHPGADTDEASALVAALRAEGFDAEVVAEPESIAGADLVHLLGVSHGRRARTISDTARKNGVAVAIHAYEEASDRGGWWGAAVHRMCFEYGSDERAAAAYLALLARRAVTMDGARGDVPYAPDDAAIDEASAALRDAAVVFAASAAEAEKIRSRSGRRGPISIVPPLAAMARPEPIGALVGPDPFVLAHAPIGPIGNQLLLARAAADADIPLVVAGPVVDASYLERVREFGGSRLIVLAGEPSPGIAAGLCAAAAVAADAAWIGDGGSRSAAAALSGAQLALAASRPFASAGVEPHRFDPAGVEEIARALGAAWDSALRRRGRPAPETVAALAPAAAIRAIVRGYAAVASAPA